MASILRVNTLTDASSNNSTAMSTINQGTAKAWVKFGADAAADDSFNNSSITDNDTGRFTVTRTNGMNNTDYVTQVNGDWTFGTDNSVNVHTVDNGVITGTQTKIIILNTSFAQYDPDGMAVSVHGDLA
tara:strand:+ start:361 stop:747 length:387 start_codon:yes stop_codon:yes gene_type:complete